MKLRNTKITVLVLLPVMGLVGCSTTSGLNAPSYNDQNFEVMTQDIEDTICTVKGKQIMEKKDVENFRALTTRLETYNGSKKEEVSEVIIKLDDISTNWSASLGIDLGEKNGKMLTDLCEKMETR